LTSDYLKQLQLTKQLERKAKEAARERKVAEARLTEVQAAIEKAKAEGLSTEEAERTCDEAREAFARRDHAAVLSLATKCQEQLDGQRRARAHEILEAARELLAPVPGDSAELEALLEQAAATDVAAEEAIALAERARSEAGRFAAARFDELVARAGALLDLADRTGVAADGRQELERAKGTEDRTAAWAPLTECMAKVLAAFDARSEARAVEVEKVIAEAAAVGADLSALGQALQEVRALLEKGEVEASLELLERTEGSVDETLVRAVEARLEELRRMAGELAAEGGDLRDFEEAAKKAEERRDRSALPLLRRADLALQHAVESLVLHSIEPLRPRLGLANRLGADLGPALASLEGARQAARERDLHAALDRVAEAERAAEEALRGHVELARELARTRELFLAARAVRLTPGSASEVVADSRQRALAGDLVASRTLLAEAGERMHALLQDAGARRALAGLTLLSEALAMGAEAQQAEEELMERLEELREGEVIDTVAALDQLVVLLRERCGEAARERVARVEGRLSTLADPADLAPQVKEARTLLEQGELLKAALLAGDVEAEAITRQHAAADALAGQVGRLLDIANQLGAETEGLQRALGEIDRFADPLPILARLTDLNRKAEALARSLLEEAISRLQRSSAAARKNGVRAAAVERLCREVSAALPGSVEDAFARLRRAEGELEKLVALHTEVYDSIVTLSRLAMEARLPPGSAALASLEETKRLFEAGRYDGARISARACLQEMEAAAAPVLAARLLAECRDLAEAASQVGVALSISPAALQAAEDDIAQGRAEQAAAALRDARQSAIDAIRKELERRIMVVGRTLRAGDRLGVDVTGPREVLDKASSLLADDRYLDAHRAVRFAASEAERAVSAARAVEAEVETAERALADAEESGIAVLGAPAVLAQARRFLDEGKHPLARERAGMVRRLVREAAIDHIASALETLESEHGAAALIGEDLARTGLSREAVLEALEARGPSAALRTMRRYASALAGAKEARALAEAAVEEASRCPQGSAQAEALPAAREAMGRGAFVEAAALLRPAGQEQAARDALDARRGAVLAALRPLAGSSADALLAEMRTAAPERFWKLHREVLRRASRAEIEARQEELAGLVDALRALLLLTPDELSPAAQRLLSRRPSELDEIELSFIPQLREEAEDAIRWNMREVREVRQAYIDATRAALAEAAALLSEGCLARSALAVVEARHALGWTVDRRRALWEQHRELRGRLRTLEVRGADVARACGLLAKAVSSSPHEANEALEAARSLVEREERALAPRIRVEVLEAREANGSRKVIVDLINEGGAAVGVRAEGADGVPAVLPSGRHRTELEVRDRELRLCYRPLFSRTEETVTAAL